MTKILAIDDSRSALEVIAMTLVEAGYQVHTCTDGKSAVQMLQQERFDLIITDIYMPEEDGLEVIRERREICPDVPIVAISGVTGQRSMLTIAKYMGACQTLQKPFTKQDLLSSVSAALGTRRPA